MLFTASVYRQLFTTDLTAMQKCCGSRRVFGAVYQCGGGTRVDDYRLALVMIKSFF